MCARPASLPERRSSRAMHAALRVRIPWKTLPRPDGQTACRIKDPAVFVQLAASTQSGVNGKVHLVCTSNRITIAAPSNHRTFIVISESTGFTRFATISRLALFHGRFSSGALTLHIGCRSHPAPELVLPMAIAPQRVAQTGPDAARGSSSS